jgi:apolipoprotein N-acyltransferase
MSGQARRPDQPRRGWAAWARARTAADGGWAERLGPVAAVATGLLLAAAFPSLDLWPLAFVALVPLLLAVAARGPAAAFRLGWVAGFVFIGLHAQWVAMIGDERAAGVAAWLALSAVMAVFFGAFFALVAASRGLGDDPAGGGRSGLGALSLVLLAAAWGALELARAHWPLGGFAWGLLGLTQHDGGPLLPLARVVGVYGLSAVIVAVNLALAAAVGAARRHAGWRRPAAWVTVAALLPLLGLAAPPPPQPAGAAKRLVVVQGNVPFDRDNRGRTNAKVFADHVALTEGLAAGPVPDMVIWAEGAADEDPVTDPVRAEAVARAARAARAPILLGATTNAGGGAYHTEALLYGADGRLADRYVKRRLVPFGEYVPWAGVIRRLIPATGQLPYDKVPGDRLEPLLLDGAPFGTVVCYETAYPEDARKLAVDGAEFIVMLTNNASFGNSPIARQHLASSQLRAVEQGRTVVHAAISGISAVIGPDARIQQSTGLYTRAVVTAEVAPRTGLTPYARFGGLFEAALVGATATLLLLVAALSIRDRPARAAVVERAAL